ncbi:MAG: type I DNA topoisomerase [Flavobacteriaceae bacterium]|nr:type I DNA topoisomerase [Flavobacteriaceae bacterium]
MSQTDLVIVESPAKARTIKKILGKNFVIASSIGHVADLPAKEFGVDIKNGFEPKYVVNSDKVKILRDLRKKVRESNTVWLASDDDREGEAIAWHLFHRLKLTPEKTKRITFTEITPQAIKKAVENPTTINSHLVDAQKARRVLDRLVGYELSPLLWRKIKGGLSAGRVQSVAVRLIVEREKKIESFQPQEFYKVEGHFQTEKGAQLRADLISKPETQQLVLDFLKRCKSAEFTITNTQSKPGVKSPPSPFTTSSLQQIAYQKLKFPVSKTMRVAQQLYEEGWITYMRTDNLNFSKDAIGKIEDQIIQLYGSEYVQKRTFKSKSKTAQEAHEAIRPTYLDRRTYTEGDFDKKRLYQLIWNRSIASQMSQAKIEKTKIEIGSKNTPEIFRAEGEVITFEGFLKVYQSEQSSIQKSSDQLPKVIVGQPLTVDLIKARLRFTKPPVRFTEASLVKHLEELGIGRPSTYAPIVTTIQKRQYVEIGKNKGRIQKLECIELKDNQIHQSTYSETAGSNIGKLLPTDIGRLVNDFLVQNFEDILDYGFTAQVEQEFDDIAQGKRKWVQIIEKFYSDFQPSVEKIASNRKKETGERILGEDPKSKKVVKTRLGKYGPIVQLGEPDEKEKPVHVAIPKGYNLSSITLEQALDLLSLPRVIGEYQSRQVATNYGKYGPYVLFDGKFYSFPSNEELTPFGIELTKAIEIIEEKKRELAPIFEYQKLPVVKGKGRFGPYLKWNNQYINIPAASDINNLNQKQIIELIEKKIKSNKEKIIHNWEKEGIRIEKARWGTSVIIKGKKRVTLPKSVHAVDLTLEQAKKHLQKK